MKKEEVSYVCMYVCMLINCPPVVTVSTCYPLEVYRERTPRATELNSPHFARCLSAIRPIPVADLLQTTPQITGDRAAG